MASRAGLLAKVGCSLFARQASATAMAVPPRRTVRGIVFDMVSLVYIL